LENGTLMTQIWQISADLAYRLSAEAGRSDVCVVQGTKISLS
jgi:hypothetical protein